MKRRDSDLGNRRDSRVEVQQNAFYCSRDRVEFLMKNIIVV